MACTNAVNSAALTEALRVLALHLTLAPFLALSLHALPCPALRQDVASARGEVRELVSFQESLQAELDAARKRETEQRALAVQAQHGADAARRAQRDAEELAASLRHDHDTTLLAYEGMKRGKMEAEAARAAAEEKLAELRDVKERAERKLSETQGAVALTTVELSARLEAAEKKRDKVRAVE